MSHNHNKFCKIIVLIFNCKFTCCIFFMNWLQIKGNDESSEIFTIKVYFFFKFAFNKYFDIVL